MAKKKVLIAEAIAQAGIDLLSETCEVDVRLKPSPEELLRSIGGYDGLVVRSGVQVTDQVLAAGAKLTVVGRAGTGVDNIDLDAATRRGVLVVNAPTSNTIAVAEHTFALMLSLARHVPQANASMHVGQWEKKALMGTELRGKVLGLVGLGRVGAAVAARAQGFEMEIIAYDPFVSVDRARRLNVEMVRLEELLSRADYVSLHAPSTERTRGMIGADEFALMKPSAYLINCARGELIERDALVSALQEKTIAGAALDVFVDEPDVSPVWCDCPNLILTPHLGASTEEAQSEAAIKVATQLIDVFAGRPPRHPVNLTVSAAEELAFLEPYLDLANRVGRFYAQFAENNLKRVELTYGGDLIAHDTTLITAAALAGLLSEAGDETVNLVNARLVARERGLTVSETHAPEDLGFSGLVTLRAQTTTRERLVSGAVMRGQPHIVRVDGYWLDFVPTGALLVDEHVDRPGIVGRIGTLLGDAGVNISFLQLGRETRGGQAIMVLGLDEPLTDGVLARVAELPSVCSARAVHFAGQ